MLRCRGFRQFGVANSFSSCIRTNAHFRRAAYLSSFFLSLLVLFTLCPLYFVPPVTEAATKNPNPSTLTYNATSTTASVSFDVVGNSGTFASSSTSGTNAAFSLATDNATGYTLNLKVNGTSGTTSLIDSTNSNTSTNHIDSITSTKTSSNFTNNTWGILPSKYNGTANTTNYYPASTTGFKMDETSAANTTANNYTVGLGLKVDNTVPAGTYTNSTIIAEYVANAVTYSINYYSNTNDTVTNMPGTSGNTVTVNPQTGTVAQGTTSTSVTLASAPTRTGYTFVGWCKGSNSTTSNITVKTDGTPDICANSSTNQFTAGQSFGIDATTSPDTYYLFAMWQKNSYTCTKRYRLQNADGTFPSSYTTDTEAEESVLYGDTCAYNKTVTDYKSTATGTNNSTASTSGTMTENGLTLSLDLYRNTYGLTVSKGTNVTAASATTTAVHTTSDVPYYRWGQTVSLSATKATNVTCTTYATPTWTATAGTAPAAGASSTYTMPKSNATVTATSTASNVAQTITLSRSGGASGITIASTNYTGTSVNLNCGTYNISGTYDTGYEFSSWNASGLVSVTSTTSASTSIYVSGPGTLTLTGKQSAPGYCTSTATCMQTFTTSSCTTSGATLTDARDGNTYTVKKIGNLCWMTANLKIIGTISASLSNFTGSDVNITVHSLTSGDTYTEARSTLSTDSSYPGAYYNYCAASAGTICTDPNSAEASSDICPSGWRLPTVTEFGTIGNSSSTYVSTFSPIYSGTYSSGWLVATGSFGRWWSATAGDATTGRYALVYNSGMLFSNINFDRMFGLSVRCVMKNYMQDQTASSLAALMPNEGDTATLTDKRDGQEYGITKRSAYTQSLYWMTKNLNLAGGTTLTSSDSNVSSEYTLPVSETLSTGITLTNSGAFSSNSTAYVYNSNSTSCSSSSACYGYYSYKAATAGTNPSSNYASSDICPKGWRLPTSTEISFLTSTLTSAVNFRNSYLNVYNGAGSWGQIRLSGSDGFYWSSGAYNNVMAYGLDCMYYNSSVSCSMSEMNKYRGHAVRCVVGT